jgi:transcriptional regulator with PAS, ATPase and Fis domain
MDQPYGDIVGESPAMKEVFHTVDKVATTDVNVLILGENGTGKELVAREIHRRSGRSNEVFMHVDLGSLSESLFESELFGHVRGAFTDAKEDRKGRFEMAHQGTLLLDEIGNLSMPLQSKLLTAIQQKTIHRVGSAQSSAVDVRLICATNRPLKAMVSENTFREDLLYRINTVELLLPPLRERREDLPLLAEHFMALYRKKYRKPNMVLDRKALEKLQKYTWPGNIRELQHVLERTVILVEDSEIKAKDLVLSSGQQIAPRASSLNLEEIERNTILKALKKHQYNLSAAAKELGLGRTTLYRKMNKYEL